jgi:hypothetical protein
MDTNKLEWTNYFQNLNSLSEIDKSKINQLNDILADLEKENLSTVLDYKVTNQEIFKDWMIKEYQYDDHLALSHYCFFFIVQALSV